MGEYVRSEAVDVPGEAGMKDGTQMLAPRARSAGLVVRALDEELLIYDLQRERAYALTRLAGLVWNQCDGRTTVGEMPDLLAAQVGEPVSLDLVWEAVSRLATDGLLEAEAETPAGQVMTRRALMQKVALAGSVALITSIAVPASAALAACIANACKAGCTVGANCTGSGPRGTACTMCGGPASASCKGTCCDIGGYFDADDTTCSGGCCAGYTCKLVGGGTHRSCSRTPGT
jgi:hypothetical protein